MTPAEFDAYMQSSQVEPVIRGEDFPRMNWTAPERLLCKGYHANNAGNLTIWLDWRQLIGRQFNDEDIVWKGEWTTSDLFPTKRAYREDTDLRFALLMRDRHIYPLSFANWRIGG